LCALRPIERRVEGHGLGGHKLHLLAGLYEHIANDVGGALLHATSIVPMQNPLGIAPAHLGRHLYETQH
jgi:hypothetical protein